MSDKKIILFIDDSLMDRTLVNQILVKNGFDVLLAEDGPQGMRMAQEQKPDLILLDVLLPGISGIEICKKLKRNPSTEEIPVIFYTSIDTPKDLIDYASYGASDYIQKTMPPEKLVASIKSILSNRES
ncbi:MAG: response regulator [Candidatus Omnitrophica bacterium]|nr:response regulator [Candidatus Omnitrophota bacterium]